MARGIQESEPTERHARRPIRQRHGETTIKRILLGVTVVMVAAGMAGPVAQAQEMYRIGAVLSDKVVAVIGGSISGNSLTMIQFSEKAGGLQLVPAASAKISNPVKKWVFQFCSSDVREISLILNFLKTKGITSIAMLADSTAGGVSGKEELDPMPVVEKASLRSA